jgi:hypothetical protein
LGDGICGICPSVGHAVIVFAGPGASTWFARSYKTGTEYIRERTQFKGSFFDNYPRLFAKDPLTFDPQPFSNYGHHLYFHPTDHAFAAPQAQKGMKTEASSQ